VLATFAMQSPVQSQYSDNEELTARGPWSWSVRGGVARQFATDIDGGGEFSVNRLFIEPGVRYRSGNGASVGFTMGYGYYGYDFSGSAGVDPWSEVNSLFLSFPMRWRMDERSNLFVIPTVRSTAESGADFGESITGGALVGFSYKFSNSLTLGPGIGALTQIEDGGTIFPFLLLNWKITDALSLRTGSGLAATLGPGLTLAWRQERQWEVAITARRSRTRFRLDDSGVVPGGVGEDRSFDIYGSVGYQMGRDTSFSLFSGLPMNGELRVEDANGNRISNTDYDSALILGATFRMRF
jgi:hypothetical protein